MSLEAIVSILFIFKVGAPCPHPPPLFSSGSKSLLFCFCFFSKYNLLQIHRIFLLSFISFCLNKSWRLDLHYDSVAEVLPNVGLTTCLICRVLKKQRSISVVMCSSKVLEYGTFFFTNAFVLPQSSFWCCHLCRRKVYIFFFFRFAQCWQRQLPHLLVWWLDIFWLSGETMFVRTMFQWLLMHEWLCGALFSNMPANRSLHMHCYHLWLILIISGLSQS